MGKLKLLPQAVLSGYWIQGGACGRGLGFV